ncbi:hypothetical protein TRFO_24829 [Tritrichomonas foetus]|uniref:Uncharacterized protein n=1 Tax=Tritrichomonas foetus TaxID=1144522 RepID=A0A1J4KC19_9EUKA|nr:hypothetical protein TRFO_24829 [Tritrichomonas foetus]|eukprot:OHT07013.1 hypothetical protein TRFO_24829 [Tritrichomonas foetus]
MENVSGEDLFIFFHRLVPSNVSSLFQRCNNDIEQARLKILSQQRKINNYDLLALENYPEEALPEKGNLLRFIFNQQILSSQEISSSFIQDASLLITQIYNNIDAFATAVINLSTSPKFDFIINSVIPSIFGYFSSGEYNDLASIFYTHVIGQSQPKIACKILAPYFRSVSTFRFIECVMYKFSIKYGSEIRLGELATSKLSFYDISTQFLEYLNSSLPLIPSTHIVLLNLMKSFKWTQGYLNYFFFHQFFIHEARRWIESSPYAGHSKLFNQILIESLTKGEMKHTIDLLTNSFSQYELTYIYQPLNQSFIVLLISPYEIYLLNEIFDCIRSKSKEIGSPLNSPSKSHSKYTKNLTGLSKSSKSSENLSKLSSLKSPNKIFNYNFDQILNLNNIKHDLWFAPTWIRIFFKSSNYSNINRLGKIIFPKVDLSHTFHDANNYTTDECVEFERLYKAICQSKTSSTAFEEIQLNNKFTKALSLRKDIFEKFRQYTLFQTVDSLVKNSDKFEMFLIHQAHHKIIKDLKSVSSARYSATFAQLAMDRSYYFSNKRLNQINFLVKMQPFLISLFQKFTIEFNLLTKLWTYFTEEMKEKPIGTAFMKLTPRKQMIFWECVEQLRNLSNVQLFFRFEVLNDILRKIEKIGKKMEYMLNALIMTENNKILTTFSLFSTCLMKNDDFQPYITDEIIGLWARFESVFLSHLSMAKSPELPISFITIQSLLDQAMRNES